MGTIWLRKKHLRERYGNVCDRSIERAIKDERLPPPEFPFGNRIPAWREDVLDAHDRKVALAPRPVTAGKAPRPKRDGDDGGSVVA